MFTSLDITDSVTDLTSSTENESDSSVKTMENNKISDESNIKMESGQRQKIVTQV